MIAGSRKIRVIRYWSLAAVALLGGAHAAWAQQDDADELEPAAKAVVQPIPSQQSYQLNAALTRLATNPRDVSALIDAGNAALVLGDNDAALGFFGRADQISPGDPRVKAALASALVKNEDPFAAIPLFDAAERAGARDGSLAGDRGLAYDLVGDNFDAQRYYRQALATAPQNDEIVRRLALSQAIAGDRKGAEATLLTQLRRNDPAAWRTRAFMLAILGDTEEAVKIATGTMPRDLADAMIPYLRYMGRLTPAQQAAAANFGHFPRAAQIGRDDPRVASYAALNPRRSAVPSTALAAKSNPLGKKGKSDRVERRRERVAVRDSGSKDLTRPQLVEARPTATTRPAPKPTPAPAPVFGTPTAPAVHVAAATMPPPMYARAPEARSPIGSVQAAMPTTPPQATVGPAFASLAIRPTAPPPSASSSTPATGSGSLSTTPTTLASTTVGNASSAPPPPVSALELARQSQQATSSPATAPPSAALAPPATATPVPAPAPRRDLASVFSDFQPPADEQRTAEMVDISKLPTRGKKVATLDERGPIPDAPTGTKRIAAAEPAALSNGKKGIDPKTGKPMKPTDKSEKTAKPTLPSHPSRIWVQLGVGRNKDALGFDWRKLTKAQTDLFKGKKAWTTPWGQTNRLLVGPFETQAAASAFLKEARKKDGDAFVWTSPAGQAVDALGAK